MNVGRWLFATAVPVDCFGFDNSKRQIGSLSSRLDE